MNELQFHNIYNVYTLNCDVLVYTYLRKHLPSSFSLEPVISLNNIPEIVGLRRFFLIIDYDKSDIKAVNEYLNNQGSDVLPQILYLTDNHLQDHIGYYYHKNDNEYQKAIHYIHAYSGKKSFGAKLENISESIEYAGKIQQTIFSDENILKANFSDYFVYNQPRDIVSGDFYWYATVKDTIYVAAGDCTGHGIPGAFMSILSVTLLNEIVYVGGNYDTDSIINKLRENIILALSQSFDEEPIHDGLDLALCSFNLEYDLMQFSGAFNPAIIIRDKNVIELKADRMPVGIYIRDDVPFTKHNFEINKGDIVYLFSDGFSDQIGGPRAQKLRRKRFLELLVENSHKSMKEQKQELNDFMTNWRGCNDQIDDMLVLGLKI